MAFLGGFSGAIFGQKNQSFSTMDLLLLVGLVGGIGSVFGIVLAQSLQDTRTSRARMTAENLARQIEDRQLANEKQSHNSRSPASVNEKGGVVPPSLTDGRMGRDPWGRAFHYAVRDSKVFVWSDGPNGKIESKLAETLILGGDDVGHSRAVPSISSLVQ
jgi:type II secretory pathway pseudopilin PulG